MTGAGRLADTEAIVAVVAAVLESEHDLAGQTVLVTAGPTQEEIDPVRYITNRSSGRMGYAIAEAAARRGAHTILVSGPTSLAAPADVEMVQVQSAAEMSLAVLERLDRASVVVMSAAVADYTPVTRHATKMKKQGAALTLELEPTRDILAEIGRRKGDRLVVGFAAETEHLVENGTAKLRKKNLDMIVANDVSGSDAGFDSEYNAATILSRDGGVVVLPRMTKREMAERILDQVAKARVVSVQ
jgi:phosphopantothenoylcysteine decarboxylase/phosphopantothenate--cysteine ligase